MGARGTKPTVILASAGLFFSSIVQVSAQCPSSERAHLFASDGAIADTFGRSVALDGTTLVVGSHNGDTAAGQQAGSAYVFELIDGTWTETAHLFAPDASASDIFGFSVAISGDTIVVGASDNGPGAAYVFEKPAGEWVFQQQLFASDGASGDDFGHDVAISGETILVGAREDDMGLLEDVGSAYFFVRSNGQWTEQFHLLVNSSEYGAFARAVAISGDTAVIGPYRDNNTGAPAGGGALVLVRNGGVWSEEAVLSAPGSASGDGFGNSIATDGDTIIVGADRDATAGGIGAGSAVVFTRNGGAWSVEGQLFASDGAANDFYGTSVGVSGDIAVVGAFFDNTPAGTDAGSAYVYKRIGGAWVETAQLFASDTAANDNFGVSAAVSGGTIVVGAYADDTPGGLNFGSAYVFSAGLGGTADVDGDGDGDLDDALILSEVLVEIGNHPTQFPHADIDCSGNMDARDIQAFIEHLLGS